VLREPVESLTKVSAQNRWPTQRHKHSQDTRRSRGPCGRVLSRWPPFSSPGPGPRRIIGYADATLTIYAGKRMRHNPDWTAHYGNAYRQSRTAARAVGPILRRTVT